MTNQIIVPERRIEFANGDNDYSRRDFLGLVGRVGAGILAAGVGLSALVAPEAEAKNGKKKLKWKDYNPRKPEEATITYDPETDRTLSKEFIEWDMKGFYDPKNGDPEKCDILNEDKGGEPDLPAKILKIGEELKIDPCVIVASLYYSGRYGKNSISAMTKTPWGYPAVLVRDVSEDKVYTDPTKGRFIKFDTWAEGIKACWGANSNKINLSDSFPKESLKPICTTITQMQLLDEALDKKTKPGKEYDLRYWKQMWDAVKKKVK